MNVHLKLEEAKYTGLLHLAQKRLRSVPADLFRLNFSALFRLDLGFNQIQTLPDAIGQLTSLDSLWLNDNPITSLPTSIYKCANLQVLDLNHTALTDLPCEMGRLTHLAILDMDEVPLHPKLLAATTADPANVCAKTLAYLHRKDVRRRQKQELYDKLKDGPYLESADSNEGQAMIQSVMKRVLKEFQTEEDVKSLIRNVERLFPPSLTKAQDPTTATSVRAAFTELKRDNEKKKLAAELELKIRNIYFDRIDPSSVEPMVSSIYLEIKALNDIKFLIRHATALFPPTADLVNGSDLRKKLVGLQEDMARERAAAIEKVLQAVTTIYSDAEPDKVKALVAQVAPLFKVISIELSPIETGLFANDKWRIIMSEESRPPLSSGTDTGSTASNPESEQEYILKVVLIGDSGVGKSNLVQRFTKNKYNEASTQTIGFEFAAKTIRVGDRRIKAQIWDTAGQERFQSLTAAYYRNAVGALVVYDITDRHSFEHVTHWLEQIREHAHENVVLILVGNKCDLAHVPNTRQVSTLEAARFAETHHMEFVEASALDSTNVVEAFKRIIVPVGRLLTPPSTSSATGQTPRLPPGWRRVLSRTRPGEYSYENQYTKERLAFAPQDPAKPSQYSFEAGHGIPSITMVSAY
ncbi:hypothetical protein B5M09_002273 [Aphanomyces astaci]|uniref:Uncharacterized protein n=1 Tax=Aphanomyces astaci TaxID=112090 RepID=A0A425DKQ2_APHAT|nr:hypothetical protein B5M09_002273 [Aphanomyces astaci]